MSTLPIAADLDAMDVIQEEARAIAQFFGVQQCDVAAQMLTKRVAERLGGQRVWVQAAGGRAATKELHARVRLKFNGRNYADIAQEEGLSVRQVRRICNTRK